MIPAIDVSELSPAAQKLAGPTAPERLQEMAARGIAPGVRPGDAVSLVVLFATSERAALAEAAKKTLSALPEKLLAGALTADLQPAAIDALVSACAEGLATLEKLVAMPRAPAESIEALARTGSERVTELIATNEHRLLEHPKIIEALYLNKRTRMSTSDRLVDLALRNGVELTGIPAFREIAVAVQGELIMEPSTEPLPDDVHFQETQKLAEELASAADEDTHEEDATGVEKVKDRFVPLSQRISEMTMSTKVRTAILGTKEERMVLVRDQNKVVASAAIRSPLLQESEVVLISRNRNVADEVLRVIATSPEWLKSYQVKRNLIENAKTPPALATKLIIQLREADLRHLAKNKNVSTAVKEAAQRHLDRRKS